MLIIVRLQESIDAVCPGANVQLRSGEYSLDFAGTETAQQRTAAQAALAAFDASQAAHDAWEFAQRKQSSLDAFATSKDSLIVALRAATVACCIVNMANVALRMCAARACRIRASSSGDDSTGSALACI